MGSGIAVIVAAIFFYLVFIGQARKCGISPFRIYRRCDLPFPVEYESRGVLNLVAGPWLRSGDTKGATIITSKLLSLCRT